MPDTGPHAVGSSCMQARPATAAPMADYLVGRSDPQGSLYLDQLISDREATLVIDVKVPKDFPHAGRLAGRSLPMVLTVFYPTPADTPRPDCIFPDEAGSSRLLRMHEAAEAQARGWEAAFFAAHLRGDPAARAPLRGTGHAASPSAVGRMRLRPFGLTPGPSPQH